MDADYFNLFIVNSGSRVDLSDFISQCNGFSLSLETVPFGTPPANPYQLHDYSHSFSIQTVASGHYAQSVTVPSSSASIQSQNGWLSVLRVTGCGEYGGSFSSYDAQIAALEQILSSSGVIVPPSITASLGLDCGVYVLTPLAQAASSTLANFTGFLREKLGQYEKIGIFFIESETYQRKEPKNYGLSRGDNLI
jgi:hypothetical protein